MTAATTTTRRNVKTEFIVFGLEGATPTYSIANRMNEILKDNEFVSVSVGGDQKVCYIVLVYREGVGRRRRMNSSSPARYEKPSGRQNTQQDGRSQEAAAVVVEGTTTANKHSQRKNKRSNPRRQ